MLQTPQLLELDFGIVYYVACLTVTFFVYSFAGWLWEVVVSLYQHHRFVNRGFVYGPVCPIYGVGALLAILALQPIPIPVVQFVVGLVLAGVLEYGTSWAMEKLFHARWWDYSDMPLNLNGRICLLGLLIFSTLMLLVNHVTQPLLERAIEWFDPQLVVMVSTLLTVGFVVDYTLSMVSMQSFTGKVAAMQMRISALSTMARERVAVAVAAAREAIPASDPAVRKEGASGLDELKSAAKDIVPSLKALVGDAFTGWSTYERKSMSDPRFKFTKYVEAYEWARKVPSGFRSFIDSMGKREEE